MAVGFDRDQIQNTNYEEVAHAGTIATFSAVSPIAALMMVPTQIWVSYCTVLIFWPRYLLER